MQKLERKEEEKVLQTIDKKRAETVDAYLEMMAKYKNAFIGYDIDEKSNTGIFIENINALPGLNNKIVPIQNTEYEGDAMNGQRHGNGTSTWKVNLYKSCTGCGPKKYEIHRYTGEWQNNKRQGNGQHKVTQYKGNNIESESTYNGKWHDDAMNGHGTRQWTKVNREYTGDWVNNEMHGKGIFTWANGTSFEGGFENNKIVDGPGTLKIGDNVYQGYWEKDTFRGFVPVEFLCPITQEKVEQAVALHHGKGTHYFERADLLEWVDKNPSHPITRQPLTKAQVENLPEAQQIYESALNQWYQNNTTLRALYKNG